jgi:capsular exopolysaccharide synthesis family protein
MGIRVLIVDADLRRPRCHTLLDLESGSGLTEVIAGQAQWCDVISPTSAENLWLMRSGSVPPNPAELLGSKIMQELLHQLGQHYEFIFVDSSPVMAVTDAVLLSTIVDGTLVVIDQNTAKPLLRKALTRLSTPHTKIIGTLLNRVDSRRAEYASYFNHYYEYYHRDPTAGT